MLKGAIARRYAGAMFELARKQNALDRTLEDLQGIAQLFGHRKLAYLLREPKVPAQRKETALRESLTSRVLPTSLNLSLLLVQRGLVELMPAVASEYGQMLLDYRNQAVAEVTSATPLDEPQSAQVKQALERATGKQILLQTRVDPGIIGGIVARVGDEVIDGSVRYRLKALQQQLLAGASAATVDMPLEGPDELSPERASSPSQV